MQKEAEQITESILEIFKKISRIPRKSGHEAKVSQHLLEEIKALNLPVIQDAVGNVIAEKAASPGCEAYPITILQAHMDMVCVAADGVAYDPLLDPIQVKSENGCLGAVGTSLGADDGIGVATILYLLREKFVHGPLRAIFTVDEENGMTGARALDEKHLAAGYLINCDSEDVDLLTVSSAGSINLDFRRTAKWVPHQRSQALCLTVKGLLGGHSGMEINCGRANAVRILGLLLDRLSEAGVDFDLVSVRGGTARNAIPANAVAVIALAADKANLVEQAIAKMNAYLGSIYGGVEKSAVIVGSPTDLPRQVMDRDSKNAVIRLLGLLHTGVYAMSSSIAGLVESSANLGVVMTKDGEISVEFFPRSAASEIIADFERMAKQLSAACGFRLEASAQSPGWPENLGSRLVPTVQAAYQALTGEAMRTESIHAGLECSWFYLKNPKLDMISIGPTMTNVHSPQEKLHLATLPLHVAVIQETLKNLK